MGAGDSERIILLLGPAFFGFILAWLMLPRFFSMTRGLQGERRRGQMLEYGIGSVVAIFVMVASVTAFFTFRAAPSVEGVIDWTQNTGRLFSRDDRLYMSRSGAKAARTTYQFRATFVADSEAEPLKLVHERYHSHGPGGEYEWGREDVGIHGGENLVTGNEATLQDEVELVWSKECAGDYKLDVEDGKIKCTADASAGKTASLWDRLVPDAVAAMLPPLPSVLVGQTVADQYQKLVGDVTQWDVRLVCFERASVGSKVDALRRMNKLNAVQARDLGIKSVKDMNTTLPLDLLDLSRHNDPELAFLARKIAERMDVAYVMTEMLAQWYTPPDKLLEKIAVLAPEWREKILTDAANTLKGVGFHAQESKLRGVLSQTANVPQRALIPTSVPAGDRYYMRLRWDNTSAQARECLAKIMDKELNLWAPDYERQLAQEKSERVVFFYGRGQALRVADAAEKCGAKTKYISGLVADNS